MLEAEGGLKQDVFFCLRADGPINVEGGGGGKFTVIKFSLKIFKILSRFGSDSFWNSEMAYSHLMGSCSHRHLIANPFLCVDSVINRSLYALAFYVTLLNNCSLFTDPLLSLQSPSSAGDKI